jgi:hypothetical protein
MQKLIRMKHILITMAAVCTTLFSFGQKLPRTSPTAEVEQMIGLTEIEVKYSRPSVKGRTIFGEVVPFGELWRTGANERSILELEDDVKIGGKELKKGKYGILTIPGKEEWSVIFSTNTESWGTNDYDEKDNALVIQVKSEEAAFTENLLFYFDELGWDKGMLVLQWERTKIRIPIEVDVDTKAWAEIQEALKKNPEDATILRNAARYCADTKLRVDEGLKYIKKAQELKSSWFNLLIEARLYAVKKDYKSAKASAQKAIEMGEADAKERGSTFAYKKMIEDEMAAWN